MAGTTEECNLFWIMRSCFGEGGIDVLILRDRYAADDTSKSTFLAYPTTNVFWDISLQSVNISGNRSLTSII